MKRVFGRVIRKILSLMPTRIRIQPVYVPVLQCDLLKGRRALITGGTSGIGFAIAKAFIGAGADVIITGRDDRRLQKAKLELENGSRVINTYVLDNTDVESFAGTISSLGIFDVLVNNAGYVGGGNFESVNVDEYDKVMDVNLKGAFFLSQTVSDVWIKAGIKGNILNICSASSLRPGVSPYILSKWGMRSLTIGMAKRLIKHGIVVNGLAPGCTNTAKFFGDGSLENPRNPSGRMITVEEVANLAVILVSDLCRMVVGDILYVTGGGAITTLDD